MVYAHVVPDRFESIFDGRSSMLFATVSGVSLGLMSGGRRRPGLAALPRIARTVIVRGVLLIALGLWFASLGTPIATIFDVYGLLFLLALPLLFAPRAVLLAVAAASALLGPAVTAMIGSAASDPTTLLHLVTTDEWGRHLGRWLTGHFPALTWLSLIVVGILIARSDLRARSTQVICLVAGTVAATLGYSLSAAGEGTSSAHSNSTWEILSSGGVAVAVIGALCLGLDWAAERGARAWLVVARPLALLGSMPLTLYCAHFAVIAMITAPLAPGTPPEDWQSLRLLAAMTVGGLAFAFLWRRRFRQGPLEWALGVLASGRRASGRRTTGRGAAEPRRSDLPRPERTS